MSGKLNQRASDPVKVALAARNVVWDWAELPLQWIPRELFASHMINVMHLLLPEGERWFVRLFSDALPLITDEQLREDVIGFIGQEGVHAHAHQGLQDYFKENGLPVEGYVSEIEHVFQRILGDREGLSPERAEEWLVERIALVAGIEHLTAFLGNWILNSPALDAAGADERVLDLLRWHGAEEVEHRAVAFDLYNHLDGRYLRRVRTYLVVMVYLAWLWARGARYLMANDPDNNHAGRQIRKARFRDLVFSKRKGLTPGYLDFLSMTYRYLLPGYHPRHEGSTSQAVAYLAKSPAALAADALEQRSNAS